MLDYVRASTSDRMFRLAGSERSFESMTALEGAIPDGEWDEVTVPSVLLLGLASRGKTTGKGLEMAGLYFEQFSVGQTFVHEIRRTVTDMDNILFCALTYNPAAVHIDHEYAKSTEFGKPLMNSIFTLGLIIGLSVQDTTLGTTVGNLGMEETKFPRPVYAGDTLRAETRILAVRESKSRPTQGIVTFEHRGFNQRDEEIAYCRRAGLMMGRTT
jgi:acyl dehydratase